MQHRIGACDLGKATASFAVAQINDNGKITLEDIQTIQHNGKVVDVFQSWYQEQKIDQCQGLTATGVYTERLKSPVVILPEDNCQEAQLESPLGGQEAFPDAMSLVSVGASGYRVLSRTLSKADGKRKHYLYQFIENDKCSSGTGENLQKLVNRFGFI